MVEVICLGELLIDFVSTKAGVALRDAPAFKKAAGGAPANVAVGLAKLGVKSGFIGKVGDDQFGYFLEKTLKHSGVDTSHILFERKARTMLAFVSLTSEGERSFIFYRHPSADMLLEPGELDESYIRRAKIFHFGSISLINNPSNEATLRAVEIAKKNNLLISYDPNLRLSLWDSPENAKKAILSGMKFAQVVKMSEDEYEFIAGGKDLREGSKKIFAQGVKLLIISGGAKGCYYSNGKASGYVDGFPAETVDTTGAGDAFMAAILAELLKGVSEGKKIEELKQQRLSSIMEFANMAGALTTTKKGAIPALPTRDEIWGALKR